MRNWLLLAIVSAGAAQTPPAADWLLPNFADRLELDVTNPSPAPLRGLAAIPALEASRVALRFPGTLAIAVLPGAENRVCPLQAIDFDGNGTPDEVLVEVELAASETRRLHVYYSSTLHDSLPWPKRVHASHAYGYNRSTAALEAEAVGYRSYGGLFLDIQARPAGRPGLFNSLVGWFGARAPSQVGIDVIHLGDTLGLGGLFLRAGGTVYRPPVNMPDYAHKPPVDGAPEYRVIADGPLRAIVEAKVDRWRLGEDEVSAAAVWSIDAGERHVRCAYRIAPLRVSRAYEVGMGMLHLPAMQIDRAGGRIALTGQQSAKTGPLGLAVYWDPAHAAPAGIVTTRYGANEAVVFKNRLEPGRAAEGSYAAAGAWSGSGIADLMGHLKAIDPRTRVAPRTGGFQHSKTPRPDRVQGEAD